MARSGQTQRGAGSVPVSRMPVQERDRIARDEETAPETLAKLVTDKSLYVRGAVAKNRSTPPEALQRLFDRNDEPFIDHQLVSNPNLPAAVAVGLAERHLMEQKPGSNGRHLYAMLKPLLAHHRSPELIETLARSRSPLVQEEAAKDPLASPGLLVKLAEPRESALGVWMAAIHNPSFPLETLEQIAAHTAGLGGGTMEKRLIAREAAAALARRRGS